MVGRPARVPGDNMVERRRILIKLVRRAKKNIQELAKTEMGGFGVMVFMPNSQAMIYGRTRDECERAVERFFAAIEERMTRAQYSRRKTAMPVPVAQKLAQKAILLH